MENMNRLPQIVEHHLENIMEGLRESFFFEDYSIKEDYAVKIFSEMLMDVYVSNPSLDLDGQPFFWDEDQFDFILKKIVTGSIMYELKEDGILESYEDEDTEETFFLTKKGKEFSKTLKKQ